jgi:hypothetical protein
MNGTRLRSADSLTGIAITLFSIAMFPWTFMDDLQTWLFPAIVLALLALFGLGLTITQLLQAPSAEAEKKDKPFSLSFSSAAWGSLAIFLCYYFVLLHVGFVLTTGLSLLLLLTINKIKFSRAITLSVGTVAVLAFTFTHVIYLALPLGDGIFRKISIFLLYFAW